MRVRLRRLYASVSPLGRLHLQSRTLNEAVKPYSDAWPFHRGDAQKAAPFGHPSCQTLDLLYMSTICYLCGMQLGAGKPTGDHRMPMLLIDREQPKVYGFDYGGKAETHETCNNRFKSENYGRKSLSLLRALYDPKCVKVVKDQVALNSSCLDGFTESDLKFFKITDVRGKDIHTIRATQPEKAAVNPLTIPINVGLSVLAKSGAALLVDRHLSDVPKRWKIYALPYVGDLKHENLERVFPNRKPFDTDVSVFIENLSIEDYLLVFIAHGVFVIFVFQFSASPELMVQVRNRFPNSDCAFFEGVSLMELVNYAWRKV